MLTNKKIRQVIARSCAVILMVGEILSADLMIAYADENDNASDHIIVSLGDSYSSGEGIEPFYAQDLPLAEKVKAPDWLAHRSQNAWGGMLTLEDDGETIEMAKSRWHSNEKNTVDSLAGGQSEKTHWYFNAVSGAVTDNIRGTTEGQKEKHPAGSQEKQYKKGVISAFSPALYEGIEYLAPQLDIFDALGSQKADYVTLTIGGNDADFTGIVTQMVLTTSYLTPNAIRYKLNKTWEKFYKPSGIKDNLKDTYKRISEKAGKQAHIIVAGYPKLFYEKKSDHYLSPIIDRDEVVKVNSSVRRFNDEISKIVEDCQKEDLNIEYVSVEEGFDGHEAYSDDSYINSIKPIANKEDLNDLAPVSAYSMHPNLKGAQVYANCVQKAINNWEKKKSQSEQASTSVDSDRAYEQYVAASKNTTKSGSWSEKMNMEANMLVSQDRVKAKTKVRMNIESDVMDYAEDDLSQLKVKGKAKMEAAKQTYTWNVDYHDGVAYYQFIEPDHKSYSMQIDPNIYNFEVVSPDTILKEEVSDGKLRFLLDGDKVTEVGLAAIQQMDGVDKLKCDDIEMIVRLSDDGKIDQVEMNFDASIKYMGYNAEVTYNLTYAFIL